MKNQKCRSKLRYSQCWEDVTPLLQQISGLAGARVLSVAAAGDNTLSIASLPNVREVLAFDFSGAQLALLELKMASFKTLSHLEILYFLGARGDKSYADYRLAVYEKLRKELSPPSRQFFDRHRSKIKFGVIHSGKLDRYFRLFSQFVLPLLHDRKTIDDLLKAKSRQAQRQFYIERWHTGAYKIACRIFFSRFFISLMGRDHDCFDQASDSFGNFIESAVEKHLKFGHLADNHYLHYILRGGYGEHLPHYLEARNYEAVKNSLSKIRLVEADMHSLVSSLEAQSIDAFNLSDVFEYMSEDEASALAHSLQRVASAGARLIYWNMLVKRDLGCYLKEQVQDITKYDADLPIYCRTFFYKCFVGQELHSDQLV
ncbi:MAG: BtaA family protein [Candidatus Obscuribacterales bacterium]|nr:BtaA family protein [Candidatus Obscuribacterales bacterium]